MNPSLERKLGALLERHQEVGLLLSQPDATGDTGRFRELSREYARLEPLAEATAALERNRQALASARAMLGDAELASMARDEIDTLEAERARLEGEIHLLLLPRDERDDSNVFLEIRAGTGGDEAALFAGDLLRM
jgi:peptide chain release factor 1